MVKRSSRSRSARAFALVDVIVATILLGVGLAVIIGLSGRAVSAQQQGDEIATAAMLADEQLHLVLARGPDDYARRFATDGACDEPFSNYHYALTFTGGSSDGDPFRVLATITWLSSSGQRNVEVETLMATRDPGPDGEMDPIRAPDTVINRNPQ